MHRLSSDVLLEISIDNVIIIHIAHYHFGVSSISLHSLLFLLLQVYLPNLEQNHYFVHIPSQHYFRFPREVKLLWKMQLSCCFFCYKYFFLRGTCSSKVRNIHGVENNYLHMQSFLNLGY